MSKFLQYGVLFSYSLCMLVAGVAIGLAIMAAPVVGLLGRPLLKVVRPFWRYALRPILAVLFRTSKWAVRKIMRKSVVPAEAQAAA